MRSGLSKTVGFGVGIALFGASSLFAIPSMIRASGADAWGSIAVGQAVGGIGAAIIQYGFGVAGPAAVARAGRADRMKEFIESIWTRLAIFVPLTFLSCLISVLSVNDDRYLAAVGCIPICTIGLSAVWYFVGTGEPYVLLWTETVPRVVGTLIGIWAMNHGGSAAVGLYWQIAGMIAGLVISTWWVMRWPAAEGPRPKLNRRPVRKVLLLERHGVVASTVQAVYAAVPIVIVGAVAPLGLTAFAVLFKLQRQFSTAMSPITQVLQGWVPRAGVDQRFDRARRALYGSTALGVALIVFLTVAGRVIVGWLGDGQIHVTELSIFLTAITIGLAVTENVVMRSCLVPFDMIALMARTVLWGSVLGVALIAAGGWLWGVDGALIGMVAGLFLRIGVATVAFFVRGPRWHGAMVYGRHTKAAVVDAA